MSTALRLLSPFSILALALFLLTPTSALDLDNDGMSDVWQRVHNIASGDGQSDIDGDGRSNAEEAEASTNPRDPSDYFRAFNFSFNPTSDEVSLTWKSIEDRYYEIEQSSDLLSWDNADFRYGEYGQTITSATFLPYPPSQKSLFFRVRGYPEYDYDSDGDSLLDWEERLLGTVTFAMDSDYDGMNDAFEFIYEFDPLSAVDGALDADGDLLSNSMESLLSLNPRLADSDGNGISDANEDSDKDGLPNLTELQTSTDPHRWDTDGDHLPDGWEVANGLVATSSSGVNGRTGDPDGDGIQNQYEYILGFDPNNASTDGTPDFGKDRDGDGIADWREASTGTWNWDYDLQCYAFTKGLDWDAADADGDPDADGLTNAAELLAGTNPFDYDTDNDYLPDGWEIQHGLVAAYRIQVNGTWVYGSDAANGRTGDPDGDGIQNQYEYILGFNANNASTGGTPDSGKDRDGDGMADWREASTGTWKWDSGLQRYVLTKSLDWEVADADGDPDADGLTNAAELQAGTNPLDYDTDNDYLPDGWEVANGLVATSSSGVNGKTGDPDGDGIQNQYEYILGFDPSNVSTGGTLDTGKDRDSDGTTDWWEASTGTWYWDFEPKRYYFTKGLDWDVADADGDPDADGLTNLAEQQAGTNPLKWDSDGDLMSDGFEVMYGLDPLSASGNDGADGDPDGDGIGNFSEMVYGSDPTMADSDGDGIGDGDEVAQGSHPADASDAGLPPDPDLQMTVKIIIGDPSGSHSERWAVRVKDMTTGKIILNHQSKAFGELSDETISVFHHFRKDRSYEFNLVHLDTDSDLLEANPDFFPDYDWALEISIRDKDGNFINITDPAFRGHLVLDPWNAEEQKLADTVKLLVNRDELEYPWEGDLDRTEQYQNKIVPNRVLLLPIGIVPDHNRDGMITDADRGKVTEETPWRFWINSDDDEGVEGGDDIQRAETPDYLSDEVDGVRDLVDFFPLHFDLKAVLEVLPRTDYSYYLKAGSATTRPPSKFSVIWYPEAELEADPTTVNSVGSYLKNIERAEDIARRTTWWVTKDGLNIPHDMLDAAKNGKGVALIEARVQTYEPLAIEIRTKNSGTFVAEFEMPVMITEVESMFRSRFLNENLGGGTQGEMPGEPANWPDADRNGKHFIFVHGYNVSGDQARGWNSEMFKRMFWSGSNAMFTGVSWHGNESQIGTATPDYWRNVHNAFQTSKSVADFVNAVPGDGKCIAAHSLGNVVVSSAIKDHGLSVANYYMVDAAAAIEAYSAGSILGNAEMSHPDWRTYDEKLWCSEWHDIFPEGDHRRKMTWRGRFEGLSANVYNFHSTGEEVLKNGDGTEPSAIMDVAVNGGLLAWVKNEMSKGSSFLTGGGLVHGGTGGWDFNTYWDVTTWYPVAGPVTRRRPPTEAAEIPRAALEENPFFDPFSNDKFHDPAFGSAEAAKYDEVSKALAESLPALTFAAGSNPIAAFNSNIPGVPDRNYDMMTLRNGWPPTRAKIIQGTELSDWRHSDIRNMAYLYTHKVFVEFVKLGGLDQ